jgi:mitochondrial distribution and morphology protein 34
LTIPLQITLSEIKLSAFIILVFSKQKGLTLVFRNDPLESIKVSSTFDSIPFIKDYLQKEIEMQLRNLMMDELPAIIHRLSLQLWCPEYRAKEDEEKAQAAKLEEETPVDPFASPPQDAVDARGNVLDASEISSLSLDGGSEIHSLFSQKNLLRLAALTDSHRTLSLFTPSIRDAVFRAWAGPADRNDSSGPSGSVTPSLARTHSTLGNTSTTYTFGKGSDDGHGQLPSRPSLVSLHTATTGLSLGAGRHSRSHANRKKKTRVVNLRKSKTTDDILYESGDSETSSAAPASEPLFANAIPEEPEDGVLTPPRSPLARFVSSSNNLADSPRDSRLRTPRRPVMDSLTLPDGAILDPNPSTEKRDPVGAASSPSRPSVAPSSFHNEKWGSNSAYLEPSPTMSHSTAPGILEQAWVLKMAGEIARRVHDEKAAREGFWQNDDRDEMPPPAYQPNNSPFHR